jgi:hypothetical protein
MLVSFVIPTRGRVPLLLETLASVQAQSYADWEAVVVDDAGTESAESAVLALAANDPRICYHRLPAPRGANHCRNLGARRARGELIVFLDSDDLVPAERLARQIPIFMARHDLDVVVCLTGMFERRPDDLPYLHNSLDDRAVLDRLLRNDPVWQTSAATWRKRFLARVGPWRESLASQQDWEFHIQAMLAKPVVQYQLEVLNLYRVPRRDSITRMDQSRWIESFRSVLAQVAVLLSERGELTPGRLRTLRSQLLRSARWAAYYGNGRLAEATLRPGAAGDVGLALSPAERGVVRLSLALQLALGVGVRGLFTLLDRAGLGLRGQYNHAFWTAWCHRLFRAAGWEEAEIRWWKRYLAADVPSPDRAVGASARAA